MQHMLLKEAGEGCAVCLEDGLSGYGSVFWLALFLQEHCSFFSTSLCKF